MTKTVIPTKPEELEDLLADRQRVEAVMAEGQFATLVQNYARAVAEKDESVATQVREETQRVLAQWLKDNDGPGARRLNLSPESNEMIGQAKNKVYNRKAPGAQLDKDYPDSASFFKAIWHNTDATDPEVSAKRRTLRNAYSSVEPGAGGFLIPETLRSELLSVALETAIVRPRARVIPMETLRVPFPTVDSTSNASSVFGGIVAFWTEEAAALTASQATFGRVVLDAKKLTIYCEVPNELLADSAQSFQAFLDQILPEAVAWYEDSAFLTGTGVGEPLGVFNAGNSATVAVSKESGQSAATIVWENIVKMYARMLPASLNRAVWVASIDTFPELATMALSVGTGGSAVWLNNGADGPPMTILGRPVIFTEKTSLLGAQGDISFVDFGQYLIGDRQTMSAESSPHYKFGNDMTAFRIIERVDGRPWMQSAITPKNSGNTLSPYVQLAVRA